MLAYSMSLYVLAYTPTSVLREEPVGLLGKAVLLMRSDVCSFISALFADNPNERVVDVVKKLCSIKTSRCFVDGDGTIRVFDLAKKPTRAKRRERFGRWIAALFSR